MKAIHAVDRMFDEDERRIYENRMHAKVDIESKIASAEEKWLKRGMERGLEKGLEQGLEQGLEKGMEQGRKDEQRKNARNMLREGLEPALIAKVTELSLDEILALQQE